MLWTTVLNHRQNKWNTLSNLDSIGIYILRVYCQTLSLGNKLSIYVAPVCIYTVKEKEMGEPPHLYIPRTIVLVFNTIYYIGIVNMFYTPFGN